MSLWDDFVQKVQGAGGAVGKTFLKTFGAQPGATIPLAQGMVEQQAVKAGMTPETAQALTDQSFNKIGALDTEQIGTQVVTPLDKYVYDPAFQALSAGALIVNPDTWTNSDSYTEALSRAWKSRQDISFGQAAADLTAYYANKAPDWGPLAELNKVDVNIYDKEIRERIYLRTYDENGNRVDSQGNIIPSGSWIENAFMGLSAGFDIAKQIKGDPLYRGAQVVTKVRKSTLNVESPELIVEDVVKFNDQQAKSAKQTNDVYREKLDLTKTQSELERVQNFQEQIKANSLAPGEIVREVNNVRFADGLDPLPSTTKLTEYVKQYSNYAKSLEKTIAKSESKIEKLNVTEAITPKVASGVKEFISQAVTRKMNWEELNSHTILRNYAVDTEFLAKAIEQAALRGENAAYDVMLLSQGEPTAAIRLAGQHADLLKIIDDAQSRLDDIELKIQDSLYQQDPSVAQALNIQKRKLGELVQAMRADDVYLNRLIGPNSNVIGTMPTMPFSANVSVKGKDIAVSPIVEKYRADRAIVKAGLENGTIKLKDIVSPSQEYLWTRVQKSPLHRATYVAQWVGHRLGREKPSGWVTLEGLDAFDGIKEVRTILEDTPVFDDLPDLKNAFADKFISAKDAISRGKVLDEIEEEMVSQTLKKFGADKEIIRDKNGNPVLDENGETTLLSTALYEKFKTERAKAVTEFQKTKVFAVDSNQTMISNPVVESQLAYARPMLDSKEFYKFIKYNMPKKEGMQGNIDVFAGSIKKVKDEWVMPVWITADRFWRADILLRLGYPKRNIISELTVISMYDGGLTGMFSGAVVQGGKNFFSNRHLKFIDMREAIKSELAFAEAKNTNPLYAIRNIFRRVDWNKYEEFASENIAALQKEKESYLEFIKDSVEHPDAYDISFPKTYETIEAYDELIALEESRLAAIAERVNARGDRFGAQNIVGKNKVVIGAHEFAGVYEGVQGKAAQILTGSAGRLGFEMSSFRNILNELGLETTDKWRVVNPTDKEYFLTLAEIANKQLRGSNTVNMILKGGSKESVIEYLNSPRGKAELEKLDWIQDQPIKGAKTRKAGWPVEEEVVMGQDGQGQIRTSFIKDTGETVAENYYNFLVDEVINNYFPTEELRNFIADKYAKNQNIASAELRLVSKNADLNPIHGEVLAEKGVSQNPFKKTQSKLSYILWDVVIKNGYKYLGEIPEDAIISHPFANSVYNKKLAEIETMWRTNEIMPTPEDILRAEYVSRKWAVKQTREYLYRITRRNGIAANIPVLAPFIQAQMSTFKRAGKLAYRNPEKAARLIWLNNQIKTHATEDEEGNRRLTFIMPKEWYDDKGFSSLFPKELQNALAANDVRRWNPAQFNLLMQGLRMTAPEILPNTEESTQEKVARWATAAQGVIGTGWTVQIIANELLKNNPYVDKEIYETTGLPIPAKDILEMFASPYPTEKIFDPFTSGWNKRVYSLLMQDGPDSQLMQNVFGKNNADFERTQLLMVQWHLDQQRLGLEEPLSNDPNKNTDMLFDQAKKEASWAIGLRLWANLTDAFVPQVESSTISPLVEEYRRYQTKYGAQAFEKWLEDYPDMPYIAVSRTKNYTGSSQSVDAAYMRVEHGEMIEEAIRANGLPREDALAFVQMVTNSNVDAPVLRDAYSGFWLKQEGDRVTLSAEEGFDNLKVRQGWSWYMDMQDEINKSLAKGRTTIYSAASEKIRTKRRSEINKYASENPEWYAQYSTLSGANSVTGFIRSMSVALNDEKFRNSLSEDSYWLDIEEIINLREDMVQSAMNKGLASPNTGQKERYAIEVNKFMDNPTTAYYFNKFLADDEFTKLALPGGE